MATKAKKIERVIVDTYFPDKETFETWKRDYIDNLTADGEDYEETDDTYLYEKYFEDVEMWVDDERVNLDKEIDGVIFAFANIGTWRGRFKGGKILSNNINSIISSFGCEYIKLYADRYNVRGQMSHHDGTNYVIFRIAPTHEIAEKMEYMASMGTLTEEYFKKHTKSLRKHVAEIYGW